VEGAVRSTPDAVFDRKPLPPLLPVEYRGTLVDYDDPD
jgi:hypothetical protein